MSQKIKMGCRWKMGAIVPGKVDCLAGAAQRLRGVCRVIAQQAGLFVFCPDVNLVVREWLTAHGPSLDDASAVLHSLEQGITP